MSGKDDVLRPDSTKKKVISYKDVFVEKKITVDVSGKGHFLVFCFQELNNLYGLSVDEVSIILYLNDLWIFKLEIVIINRYVRLGDLLRREYIEVNYSYNNSKLYSLSEKGKGVVAKFDYLLNNTNEYLSENRETDISFDAEMKSIINKLYKKP